MCLALAGALLLSQLVSYASGQCADLLTTAGSDCATYIASGVSCDATFCDTCDYAYHCDTTCSATCSAECGDVAGTGMSCMGLVLMGAYDCATLTSLGYCDTCPYCLEALAAPPPPPPPQCQDLANDYTCATRIAAGMTCAADFCNTVASDGTNECAYAGQCDATCSEFCDAPTCAGIGDGSGAFYSCANLVMHPTGAYNCASLGALGLCGDCPICTPAAPLGCDSAVCSFSDMGCNNFLDSAGLDSGAMGLPAGTPLTCEYLLDNHIACGDVIGSNYVHEYCEFSCGTCTACLHAYGANPDADGAYHMVTAYDFMTGTNTEITMAMRMTAALDACDAGVSISVSVAGAEVATFSMAPEARNASFVVPIPNPTVAGLHSIFFAATGSDGTAISMTIPPVVVTVHDCNCYDDDAGLQSLLANDAITCKTAAALYGCGISQMAICGASCPANICTCEAADPSAACQVIGNGPLTGMQGETDPVTGGQLFWTPTGGNYLNALDSPWMQNQLGAVGLTFGAGAFTSIHIGYFCDYITSVSGACSAPVEGLFPVVSLADSGLCDAACGVCAVPSNYNECTPTSGCDACFDAVAAATATTVGSCTAADGTQGCGLAGCGPSIAAARYAVNSCPAVQPAFYDAHRFVSGYDGLVAAEAACDTDSCANQYYAVEHSCYGTNTNVCTTDPGNPTNPCLDAIAALDAAGCTR